MLAAWAYSLQSKGELRYREYSCNLIHGTIEATVVRYWNIDPYTFGWTQPDLIVRHAPLEMRDGDHLFGRWEMVWTEKSMEPHGLWRPGGIVRAERSFHFPIWVPWVLYCICVSGACMLMERRSLKRGKVKEAADAETARGRVASAG